MKVKLQQVSCKDVCSWTGREGEEEKKEVGCGDEAGEKEDRKNKVSACLTHIRTVGCSAC